VRISRWNGRKDQQRVTAGVVDGRTAQMVTTDVLV